jgi:hypothetical protein
MGNTSSGTMADAIAASGLEAKELPQATELSTLRLVGIRLDGVEPNKITVPAALQRQQGTILIGPQLGQLPDIHDRLGLVRATTAVRWALDPARRPKGKKKGLTRPSISPTHKLRLVCDKCKHTEDLFWDNIFRKHSDQRKLNLNVAAFTKYAAEEKKNKRMKAKGHHVRRGEPPILCESCLNLSTPQHVRMRVVHLTTSVVPNKFARKPSDAVFAGIDDAVLDQMAAASLERPSQADDAFLPRIWAVYVRGATPTDFPPHDAKGIEIDQRLAASEKVNKQGESFTYTIRPARVAFTKEGGAGVRNFLMEANPTWTWGWVSEADLVGETDLDYTRRFLNGAVNRRDTFSGNVDVSV